MQTIFDKPGGKAEVETGETLTPRFDANGLVTAVVTDANDGKMLMLAHMNAEALDLTIRTGEAHFYSRSRKSLWKKGETSGNVLSVQEIRVDCDQDAVWLVASLPKGGAACHTGARSCFYRTVVAGDDGSVRLEAEAE